MKNQNVYQYFYKEEMGISCKDWGTKFCFIKQEFDAQGILELCGVYILVPVCGIAPDFLEEAATE